MTFQHQIILVTGGSSGIGLATAQAFAREGAHVWLLARDPQRLAAALQKVIASCRSSDQKCGAVSCDVADAEEVARAVDSVISQTGLPDIVVNSAGIVRPGYFQDLDMAFFRDIMEVDYFGALHVIKAVAPGMIARRSGRIVNVASGAALLPAFGYSAYAPAKYALRGLSDVLRVELKPYNVQVSIVYPPDTDTPQLAGEAPYKPYEAKKLYEGVVVAAPEFVAGAILTGIKRGRYTIVPGLEMKAAARLACLLGDFQFNVMDWLIARVQKSAKPGPSV
jgi:3-dehydrosphinganine reductase